MNYRMQPDDVIIRSPDRLRLPHHLTSASLTVFFWSILIWLCQPVFTLAAWYFNFSVAKDQMADEQGWQALTSLAAAYGSSIVVICSALLIWARIQQWRFRGKEKRRWPVELSNEQVAHWFGTDPFARRHWMRLRHTNVYFNEGSQAMTIRPRSGEGEEVAMDYVYTATVRELAIAPGHEVYDDFRHEEAATN